MNPKEIRTLRKLREEIVDDLDPKYILDYLVKKEIIDENNDKLIRSKTLRNQRAELLLDILPKSGSRAFDVFIESLNDGDNYPWLAIALKDEIELLKNPILNIKSYPQLLRGGVPRLGDYHVNRPKEVDDVKSKLKEEFYQNGWVVILGISGCGKSTIAVEAIADNEMLSEFYPSGVFWVPCGSIDEGLILVKMKALCELLDNSYRSVVFDSIEIAKERLREIFSRTEYLNSLLVLDNVWDNLVVDAFNVSCNTLVTTTDKDVFKNIPHVRYVNISSGFTLEQTLTFLSKRVKLDLDKLPKEAKIIHEICKGVPMLISTVGGYIADFPHDNSMWATCVQKLTRKRNLSNETTLRENIDEMIELALSRLSNDLKEYYDTLAVFRDDFYISAEVLATFWECSITTVNETMQHFINKSLVSRIWDDDAMMYFYLVFDSHLKYLKLKNIARIPDLHLKLINVYEKRCGGKWHCLKDDSYIYIALSYHLHMADLKDKLIEIYFDFQFITSKIEHTMGCADLLYDYSKYFRGINDMAIQKKLTDFKHFIRANSDLLSEKNFDILQLALCQPESSEVYKQAKRLIPTFQRNKFYYDWCNKDNNKGACISSCNIHTSPVRCAIFTPTSVRVISCDSDGIILIWDSKSMKEISRIQGHESRIRCCSLCFDHKILVTCSSDKMIKLWTVPINFFEEQNGNSDDSQDSPPTPCVTKRGSHPLWKLEKSDDSKTYYKMTLDELNHDPFCCAISKDGETVISGGRDGLIFVWSVRKGEVQKKLIGHKQRVVCCQYSPSGKILATGSEDGTIRLWNVEDDYSEMNTFSGKKDPIVSCCFSTDELLIFGATNSTVLSWVVKTGLMEQLFCDFTQDQIMSVASSNEYIAAGTAGCSIIVYSLQKKSVVNFHKGHKDWIHCVAFSLSGDRLLSASADHCIKIWDTHISASSDLKLGSYCDAAFSANGTVTALVDLNNYVEIFRDNLKCQTIDSADNNCIDGCAISNDGTLIALLLDKGKVKVYSLFDCFEPVHEVRLHASTITCFEFSQNNSFLVTGSDDCYVGILSLEEPFVRQLLESHCERITQVKLFQSDEKILSSSYDGTLVVWNVNTQNVNFKCVGHEEAIVFCDVSNNDKLIVSASTDKSAKLWDATNGDLLTTFHHNSCVRSCRFLPNCSRVVIGDDEGNIMVWKLNDDYSRELTMKCENWVSDLHICRESKYLISSSKNLRIWDLETGSCLQTFHTKGTNIRKLKTSNDFFTIVCLDDAKVFYHLAAIQKPNDL